MQPRSLMRQKGGGALRGWLREDKVCATAGVQYAPAVGLGDRFCCVIVRFEADHAFGLMALGARAIFPA
eukprot:9633048-Lingulodinium_polyedra.AAC.1